MSPSLWCSLRSAVLRVDPSAEAVKSGRFPTQVQLPPLRPRVSTWPPPAIFKSSVRGAHAPSVVGVPFGACVPA